MSRIARGFHFPSSTWGGLVCLQCRWTFGTRRGGAHLDDADSVTDCRTAPLSAVCTVCGAAGGP
eukprot:693169-Prorocentrum_minimum.AAC.1